MAQDQKKRHVVSYEHMSPELSAAFMEKYPRGFSDYLPDLIKYDKPDGTSFYAVTIEIPDAIYLVKIQIKTDDAADLERWLEGEEESETEEVTGPSASASEPAGDLPDDDISKYQSDSDGDADTTDETR